MTYNPEFEAEKEKLKNEVLQRQEIYSPIVDDEKLINEILFMEKDFELFNYFFPKMTKIFFNFGFHLTKQKMKEFTGLILSIAGVHEMKELFYYRNFLSSINDWDILTTSEKYRPLWEELLESKGDLSNLPLEAKANMIRNFPDYFNREEYFVQYIECFFLFSYIPQDLLNEHVIKIWIKAGFHRLNEIPLELRTRGICLLACEKSYFNLQYVPRHMRDYEMCYIACKTQRKRVARKSVDSRVLYSIYSCFQHVPKIYRHILSHMFFKWDGVIYDNKKEWVEYLKNPNNGLPRMVLTPQ